MDDEGPTTSVVIAVLTFRRPDDLAAVLPRLDDQARRSPWPTTVLVVDNDPDAGAREQVAAAGLPGLRYVHEPHPGIAAARNRALDEAEADLLVFIDDDERPSAGWLGALLDLWRAERPAAVVGPVTSEFEHAPDPWIVAGRFFERRRWATGTAVRAAATNNLLLDLAQVGDLRFDDAFGLSGGSDTLFTRQLIARGGRLLWCAEADVVDVVPAARLTRRWVMQRAYRNGNGWSRTSLVLATGAGDRQVTRVRLVGAGLPRLGGGLLLAGVGLLTGSLARRARGLRTTARGAGLLTGALGLVYSEYARPAAAAAATATTTTTTPVREG